MPSLVQSGAAAMEASVLMPKLQHAIQVLDFASERMLLSRLEELFPRVVFASLARKGVILWYREGDRLPMAIKYASLRSEAVRRDGTARVVKDKTGPNQGIIIRTTCPKEYWPRLGILIPEPNRKTWQEHLLDEDF
jgi:hypothetical protein